MTDLQSPKDISSEFHAFKGDMLNCLQNIHKLLAQRKEEVPTAGIVRHKKRKSVAMSNDKGTDQDHDSEDFGREVVFDHAGDDDDDDDDPVKSQSLIYYEEEKLRNRKWKSIECDEFAIDITDGERYRSLFEAKLTSFYSYM